MPSGFKGTRVELARVTVEGRATGPIIKLNVQFCNADGVVHAITAHELEPSADPRVAAALKPLMDALRGWVEGLHYEDAEPALRRVNPGGIAESLRGEADPDDGVGEEG